MCDYAVDKDGQRRTGRKRRNQKYVPRPKQETAVIDVVSKFGTDAQCLGYLEAMRWPEGVECLECGSKRISKFTTNATTRTRYSKKLKQEVEVRVPSRTLYQCLDCKYQFSATTRTLFRFAPAA